MVLRCFLSNIEEGQESNKNIQKSSYLRQMQKYSNCKIKSLMFLYYYKYLVITGIQHEHFIPVNNKTISQIYFFINCEKNTAFWDFWAIWWLNLTGYNILDDEFLIEYLLPGFPGNSNNARLINFYTIYAKYVIYTHIIKGNNNFELCGYVSYLKHVLVIEERICITKHPDSL